MFICIYIYIYYPKQIGQSGGGGGSVFNGAYAVLFLKISTHISEVSVSYCGVISCKMWMRLCMFSSLKTSEIAKPILLTRLYRPIA